MGFKEKNIINQRLLNLDEHTRLFRTNSGMAWVGSEYVRKDNILIIKYPRPFHGMPEGWPDLTGFTRKIITLDMVGEKIAVFTTEEIKASGKLSKEQEMFRDLIVGMGGEYRVLK